MLSRGFERVEGKTAHLFPFRKVEIAECLKKKRGRVYVFLFRLSSNPRVVSFLSLFLCSFFVASFRLLREFMSSFCIIMFYLFH